MKTLKLTLALCALATLTKAQYTGQSFYNHAGTKALLSSGTYVFTNPGFIMGGYLPNTAAGSPNFFIDKVDMDGTFSPPPVNFSTEYFFYDGGTGCGNGTSQELNCYGVTVIENKTAGTDLYAFTAAFDGGVAVSTTDNTGAIVNSGFFSMPLGSVPNCKPLITRAASGGFYVAGSLAYNSRDYMYVFKVTSSCSYAWSKLYDFAITNSTFTPRAIVEDSYPGYDELAIAGIVGGAVTTDGFFMQVDGSNGNLIFQEALASGQTVDETISSMELSNAGNGGYILGGRTDMSPGPGRAWMLNLNTTGGIVWSTRIDPSTNSTAGEVVGVVERFNTYGYFEYYGLTVSNGNNGGMMVLKLKQGGSAFSEPGNMNNEFVYNDAAGNVAVPAAISQLDAGAAGFNTGIHVFGTTQNAPDQFFLNQACFNGATGTCNSPVQQNLTMMTAANSGPNVTYSITPNVNQGPEQCPRYRIQVNAITYNPNQPCSMSTLPTSPYMGDQSRPLAPTGIAENVKNSSGISVYPNPVSNATDIHYTTARTTDVKITLSDVLGREIRNLASATVTEGNQVLHLDMNSMNLETGVYFINVSMNGLCSRQKLIYNKN